MKKEELKNWENQSGRTKEVNGSFILYRERLVCSRNLSFGDTIQLHAGNFWCPKNPKRLLWEYTHQDEENDICFTHSVIVMQGSEIVECYCE